MRAHTTLAAVTTSLVLAVAGVVSSPPASAAAAPLALDAPSDVTLTPVDEDTNSISWVPANAVDPDLVVQRRLPGAGFVDLETLDNLTTTDFEDTVPSCGRVDYRLFTQTSNGDRSPASAVVGRSMCAPANDDLADAEAVTVGANGTMVTDTEPNARYGSVEAADPAYSCHIDGAAKGFDGVWYSITPVADSRVTASTGPSTIVDPAAGAPDTLIAIYQGTPSLANEVACNDDISGSNFRSTTTSNVLAGHTYWIHVSQWTDVPDNAPGNLVTTFTWAAPVFPPANDEFADAATIGPFPFTETVTSAQNATVSITDDPGHACATNPNGSPRVGTHTLWWTVTPEVGGLLDVDTLSSSGSFTDTILSVLTGSPGSFASVACNDDSSGSNLRSSLQGVAVTGGTTYYVLVSRFSTVATPAAGTVVLDADFSATPGLTFSPNEVAVEEGRPGATYTARLNTQPTDDVILTPSGDADCTVGPAALTFTSADWDTPQPVTVTAVDDGTVEPTESCAVSHATSSADPAYDALEAAPVTGTVTDLLTTEITLTTPAEGALVVKDAAVAADFACTDNRAGAGIASCVGSVADGADIDTSTLGDHTFTVDLTDVYGGTATETHTYTVTEEPALLLSDTAVAVEEGKPGATYTAELSTAPTSPVTVTVAGDADCAASPTTLTFTAGDWDVARAVTVTATDEGTVEPTQGCTVTHTLASSDARFDALPAPHLSGTVTDKVLGKPDARIKSPSPLVGNNVYGGRKQRKVVKRPVGSTVTYTVSLQNDGTGTDGLRLLGGRSDNGFKVKYFAPGGRNVTRSVRAGTFVTPSLAKRGTYDLKVVVKLKKQAQQKLKVSVRATSVATPSVSDVVLLLTKRT